jgi:dipeptidyl-peptidase-4
LYPRNHQYSWVKGSDLSDTTVFGRSAGGKFVLRDILSNKTTILEAGSEFSNIDGYTLNTDQSKILLAVNKTAGFRYSFKANYFVLDLKTNQTAPLFKEQKADVQAAVWNPK